MKAPLIVNCLRACVALFLVCAFGADAQNKFIRLRNEVIATTSPQAAPAFVPPPPPDTPAVSGLYLIQFTNRLQPAWRLQLRAAGVELVRYVPEDAFVTRLDNVRLSELRRLAFVQWVGDYRPDHKIHRSLNAPPAAALGTESVAVSVLLLPRPDAAELGSARSAFTRELKESHHRWGTILRGRIPPARLHELASSSVVIWIEPAPKMKLWDEVSSTIVAGEGTVHSTAMMELGYNGSGVTVAVADSGLDSGDTNSMHPDIAGRVKALIAYGGLPDAADEHSHGTHVAGIIAGNGATGEIDEENNLYGLGVAPSAELVVQRIFDGAGNYYAPPSFDILTGDAQRAGADIGSNSWGDDTQGRYDLSAMEFDALVRDADDDPSNGDQPYILEFSAGNAGPGYQTVGSPAVAKNVIASGASENNRFNLPMEEFAIYAEGLDAMADFSSRGPCEDGRIKPDVVAPGTWIASLRSVYANDDNAWWPISDNYLYQGGTSQAGPHVSGAAAVFVQYYRATHGNATPSPALVKAALINSAADMDDALGTGPVPNADEGWGRVDLPQLIGGRRAYDFTDQTTLLTNGQVFERRIVIDDPTEPLKITLAYTDVPGFPGTPIALVNDLDLEVISPDGHIYRGNQFEAGESVPDAPSADNVNNVEAVHLFAPVPGEYIIRVRGSKVVEDARADTEVIVDQDFALVISASFAQPGSGIVTFDRPVYTAPGLIKLALVDYDLAGNSTATVVLRNTNRNDSETITLRASGSTGLFTNSVPITANGPVLPDGTLLIGDGDIIEAVYQDLNPPATRIFAARADLRPPVIANVSVTNRFGHAYVVFDTSEDANVIVRYGTNALTLSVTNHSYETTHEVVLTNVVFNQPYQLIVIAEDVAGNRATNNNGGANFPFIVSQPPDLLLVDSFADYDLGFGFTIPAPPLSGYTDALNLLGVANEVFDATSGATPTLDELRNYRCVIWRISDLALPSGTLVQNITNYLNGGGSLLLASMEALTQFDTANQSAFNSDILQVQSYQFDQPVDAITGAPGDAVGAGIDTSLNYSPYDEILFWAGTDTPSDWITQIGNATPILYSDAALVGIRSPKPGRDLPWRVVFLSFPLDTVPLGPPIGNDRAGLLRNILNFLVPQPGGSTIALDSDTYTVPGTVIVEVEDLDLEGQGQTTVTFYSPSQTNSAVVTLRETIRAGLFRGVIGLVSTNGSTNAVTLVAQSGDTIRADYFDASSGQVNSTAALVDTTPPQISSVTNEPGYTDAVVLWDTSKPADSLVQFSESPDGLSPTNHFAINFTVADAMLDTNHALILGGLLPAHTYYYQVVSRDKAGNVASDDNAGAFYHLTTLAASVPPWSDNFENGIGGWTVADADGSEVSWTLGVPGNGAEANSPPDCWGSNLSGGPASLGETVLASPGLFLGGGNQATLRFWQNYDFTGDYEFGEVWLITNTTSSSYVGLLTNVAFSAGWEPVELDLTPYLGNVVIVAFHYFLVAVDEEDRPGWLVDDVSVDVSYVDRGTIQITNNTSQAFAVLTGPVSASGRGDSLIVSNALPGEYVVHYNPVPFYDTPAAQTNTLQSGGVVTFRGNYTFTDANHNGIPDAWEQRYFGSAALEPARLLATRPTNGLVQFSWNARTNCSYRVLESKDLITWSPLTGWQLGKPGMSPLAATISTNVPVNFFRLEVNAPLLADCDGDGMSDYAEFVAGTNPTNSLSVLRLFATRPTNGVVQFSWSSKLNRFYRVVSSDNLIAWSPLTDWQLATRGLAPLQVAVPTNVPAKFFRLEVKP